MKKAFFSSICSKPQLFFSEIGIAALVSILVIFGDPLFAQNPTNGGFENGTTGWTTAGSSTTTSPRTGTNGLEHTTSSTSNVAHTNSNSISIPNNSYAVVMGWAIGSNANARASCGGTLNGTANSQAIATIGTTLTRLTYAVQNTSGGTVTFTPRVNTRSVSGSTTLYWDDVIMYSGTSATADIVDPVAPTAFSKVAADNQIALSWTNGSDASSGLNNTYILRTSTIAEPLPALNDQGVYSVAGGTSGPNTIGNWTILAIQNSATATYTDVTVVTGSTYKYAILHSDAAYNHSTAVELTATALPIELTDFTAIEKGQTNRLDWHSATETNAARFDIERSENGQNDWQKIGEKAAAGFSSEPKSYSFDDRQPLAVAFYRLQLIDLDGKTAFSNIVSVVRKGQRAIALAPNPTTDAAIVSWQADTETSIIIETIDILGRVVATQKVDQQKGPNSRELNLEALPAGRYFVRIAGSAESLPLDKN